MKSQMSIGIATLLLSGMLALTSGCGMRNDDGNVVRQNTIKPLNQIAPGNKAMPSDGNGTARRGPMNKGNRISQDQLARIAENVSGVDKATVIMNDTDVLVGLELGNGGSRKLIEKQVFSTLTWQYPEYHYHVTSNKEICQRIQAVMVRKEKGMRTHMFNKDIRILSEEIDQAAIVR